MKEVSLVGVVPNETGDSTYDNVLLLVTGVEETLMIPTLDDAALIAAMNMITGITQGTASNTIYTELQIAITVTVEKDILLDIGNGTRYIIVTEDNMERLSKDTESKVVPLQILALHLSEENMKMMIKGDGNDE